MKVRSSSSQKKYSARGLASGSAFCPACQKLTAREAQVCPACGFMGQHTLSIFSHEAPPLEAIGDYARLFSEKDVREIGKHVQAMEKRFPQIRWKILTAELPADKDPGLFGFWLLNVSPPLEGEDLRDRKWTVLMVFLSSGDVAIVPGYAVELWLSGNDWGRLMKELHTRIRRKGYSPGIATFFRRADEMLDKSWVRMRSKVRKARQQWVPQTV